MRAYEPISPRRGKRPARPRFVKLLAKRLAGGSNLLPGAMPMANENRPLRWGGKTSVADELAKS